MLLVTAISMFTGPILTVLLEYTDLLIFIAVDYNADVWERLPILDLTLPN